GIDEVLNGAARDEIRIELHQRRGPELLGLVGCVNKVRNVCCPNFAEAPREPGVVLNDMLPKCKDVQRFPFGDDAASASLCCRRVRPGARMPCRERPDIQWVS